MRTLRFCPGAVVLVLVAACTVAAAQERPVDLRRAVPAEAYMVVYGKHNPERDFQREYYKAVWKTVEETKIIPQAVQIVTSRLSRDEVDKAKAVLEEIKKAAAPIKLDALANAKEVVYGQIMTAPPGPIQAPIVAQHLVLLRLAPEAAAQTQEGIKNLFGLAEKYSEGKVSVNRSTEGDATIVTLALPGEVPFQPTVVGIGDVLLVSSSDQLARQSLGMLVRGEGKSKFDDPRLKEALKHLPEPEDSLVFYDARQQFSQMRQMVGFIRAVAASDPNAERIAGLLDLVFDEFSIVDYEVTVEYTEGNLNRSAVYGKIMPGAEKKTLGKVFGSGQPFKDWQRWVPANAVSYSLSTGANLHPLYERIVGVIKERFPEAAPVLAKFEEIQTQIGVHLDRDILQAFSGECVSVSLAAATSSPPGSGGSVLALRCQKPERIRELLHRLVDELKKHPAVAAQQLRLAKSEELDGFEELSALVLAGFGVKPVIGFRDGWMILGSNAAAVKTVLETKAGKGPTIADTKSFKQFHLKVDGPVDSIGYENVAESTRRIAGLLNQAGTIVPVIIGLVGAKADPEELKPVQEVLALLPSLGKIVAKFDFLEAKLGVTQADHKQGTYQRRSVTVVRPAPTGR